ncbi:MAG TPA: acyltransferase [Edaphobacter sp.]|jgi:peptidoglycan/LPS O-acetylase OafA/YrhL|nr:acyltransferase [Edaphobacter sp.]
MPRNISPLTSVRFFAASLVLWHHSVRIFLPGLSVRHAHGAPDDFSGIVSLAFPVSVSFFFLLSGYVLSFVYLHNRQAIDKSGFFAARFARIYPLYFVVLVLNMPRLLAAEVERHGIRIGLTKTAEIFAANAVMVQGWYTSRLLRINVPTWSLCGEVFFYLCFPLLGVLLWKLHGLRLWMTALALYAGGQLLVWGSRPHLSLEMALSLPPLHLSTFALGILLARWQTLQNARKNKAAVRVWQANIILALSVGGVLLSVPLIPFFSIPAPYNNGLLAPLFAGFIWALTVTPTPLSRWLCGRWPVALGNSSYALYLIHTPILTLFRHLQWANEIFYPVYLALCVGLSLLSFHYFETPARLWLLERFHALAEKQIPAQADVSKRSHTPSRVLAGPDS